MLLAVRSLIDLKNAAAERSLVGVLVVLIVLMESSETGGGNLVLKARTLGTVRRDASDGIGSIVGFIIVGERARIKGSSVFGVGSLSDSRKAGEVFEWSIWSSD